MYKVATRQTEGRPRLAGILLALALAASLGFAWWVRHTRTAATQVTLGQPVVIDSRTGLTMSVPQDWVAADPVFEVGRTLLSLAEPAGQAPSSRRLMLHEVPTYPDSHYELANTGVLVSIVEQLGRMDTLRFVEPVSMFTGPSNTRAARTMFKMLDRTGQPLVVQLVTFKIPGDTIYAMTIIQRSIAMTSANDALIRSVLDSIQLPPGLADNGDQRLHDNFAIAGLAGVQSLPDGTQALSGTIDYPLMPQVALESPADTPWWSIVAWRSWRNDNRSIKDMLQQQSHRLEDGAHPLPVAWRTSADRQVGVIQRQSAIALDHDQTLHTLHYGIDAGDGQVVFLTGNAGPDGKQAMIQVLDHIAATVRPALDGVVTDLPAARQRAVELLADLRTLDTKALNDRLSTQQWFRVELAGAPIGFEVRYFQPRTDTSTPGWLGQEFSHIQAGSRRYVGRNTWYLTGDMSAVVFKDNLHYDDESIRHVFEQKGTVNLDDNTMQLEVTVDGETTFADQQMTLPDNFMPEPMQWLIDDNLLYGSTDPILVTVHERVYTGVLAENLIARIYPPDGQGQGERLAFRDDYSVNVRVFSYGNNGTLQQLRQMPMVTFRRSDARTIAAAYPQAYRAALKHLDIARR